MVAWAIPDTLCRRRSQRLAIGLAATAVLCALSIRTSNQIPFWHDSVALFEHGLEVTSSNHVAHAQLGSAYLARGQTEDAVAQFEAALQISPNYTSVANNLAWLLATDTSLPDRNLLRAVELAEGALASSDPELPSILDTLAVCYAAVDRFDEAIEVSMRGIALAERNGEAGLVVEMRERLALYRNDRPYVGEKPGESF